ncbi:MAG: NTP transferase domain-containing protein [Elusimicrobia bacterium]|nr:NTP transferase domain-containing protein [Elusimicrobiota bacterium]
MTARAHAGIFAAGDGTRLKKAFPGLVKPMVPVAGKPLIYWAVLQLNQAGCGDFTVLFNSRGGAAAQYLKETFPSINFEFIIKDTASSYESFRLVSRTLAAKASDFMMTTVDAFYDPKTLAGFLASSRASGGQAAFGLTSAINDEKPLWADIDSEGFITAMGPDAKDHVWATNGVYYMTAALAGQLPDPSGYTALRQYLTQAVAGGARFHSRAVPEGADVDDPEDIRLAEEFLATRGLT